MDVPFPSVDSIILAVIQERALSQQSTRHRRQGNRFPLAWFVLSI
jgi:hypothetical protein